MIYFDNNHTAYGDVSSLKGKEIIFSCSDEMWADFVQNPLKYVWSENEIISNPDYAQDKAKEERERVGKLTMTKRIFALILKEYNISYSQLKELIATNEDAELEWDLCSELQRNNPLLDIMAAEMSITPEQLDNMFKYANGEIDTLIPEEPMDNEITESEE